MERVLAEEKSNSPPDATDQPCCSPAQSSPAHPPCNSTDCHANDCAARTKEVPARLHPTSRYADRRAVVYNAPHPRNDSRPSDRTCSSYTPAPRSAAPANAPTSETHHTQSESPADQLRLQMPPPRWPSKIKKAAMKPRPPKGPA